MSRQQRRQRRQETKRVASQPDAGEQTPMTSDSIKPVRRLGWAVWAGAIILLGSLAVLLWKRAETAEVPSVSLEGFERLVAEQIKQATNEVRNSRHSGMAWGKLGIVLQVHELLGPAEICFEQATRLERREPRWPYLHALVARERDVGKALVLLSEAAKRAPLNQERTATNALIVWLRLAQVQSEAGQTGPARTTLEIILRAHPAEPSALLALAELERAQGQFASARARLSNALASPTTARRANLLLAALEQQLGQAPSAAVASRRAASLPPDPPLPDPWLEETVPYQIGRKAWAARAQQMLTQGRFADAELSIRHLLQYHPDEPETWLLRGRLHFERKDCAGAEGPLRRHLALLPNSVNGHAQLGMVLLCLGRYAEAAAPLKKAVELKPDFAEAHFNLGFALARAGQGAQAIDSFRQAIRFSPNFIDPHITLADLLYQSGEREEASLVLEHALQLNPDDPRAKELQQRFGSKR
jgi:tetratricopeptide (TPR) repeat protein